MDADFFVPVEDLLQVSSIRELTVDVVDVVEALRLSKILILSEDERSVRPDISLERNTLILRNIAADNDISEIVEIFDEKCSTPIFIRSDVGNTWFASFESEEDCLKAYSQIRLKSFKSQPIKCGIKGGAAFRNFIPSFQMQLENSTAYSNPYYDGTERRKTRPHYSGKQFRKRTLRHRKESTTGESSSSTTFISHQPKPTAEDFPSLGSLKTLSTSSFNPTSNSSRETSDTSPSSTASVNIKCELKLANSLSPRASISYASVLKN